MARRTPNFERVEVTSGGTAPYNISMDAPADVAEGDTLIWVVFGTANAMLDFQSGGNLEGGSITPPVSWVVGEYTYYHPTFFGGNNFHIFLREWHTGDATTEVFTLDDGIFSWWNLFGYSYQTAVAGWDAYTPAAGFASWGSDSSSPATFIAGDPGTGLRVHLHGVYSFGSPAVGAGCTVNGPNLALVGSDFTVADGTGGVNFFLLDNAGVGNKSYDYEIATVDGGWHTDRYSLMDLPAAPVRAAAPVPADVSSGGNLYVRRRVTAHALPYHVNTGLVRRI